MTLFLPWLVFPLLMAGICLGCGLAVARCSRTRIQPTLLVPLGFAATAVIGLFTTLTERTASVTLPLILMVAAVGLVASIPRRRPSIDLWAVGSAVAVFAVFAAPVVLSGEATFAGYIKLDDTATFLAMVDRIPEHGRSVEGLAPSSYEAALAFNLHFYPLGSLIPLGVGSVLIGQDPAWLFQPYLAFLAALLALVLYQLAALVVASRPLRATAAVLASQAALLYGYALWGGVKELAAAPLVALTAALAGALFPSNRRGLAVIPLAIAGAALVGVLSIGAAAWLVPALVLAGIALLRRGEERRPLLLGAVLVASVVPSLTVARFVLGDGVLGSLRDSNELGNLLAPLSPLQLAGIWPTGDFRAQPDDSVATYVLIALAVGAGAIGISVAISRRAWEIALYAASGLIASVAFAALGSPWIEAKAFAIASPILVFAAVIGCAALIGRRRRTEGVIALLLVATGVVWSNVLAYREVNLAPREQLAELEEIGEQFAGTGPALMTEYQPYGVRHFLRELDAEGASELRRRPVSLKDGSTLPKGAFADISEFRPSDVLLYRTLVLRRSPLGTTPPSPYRLVWSRTFYEVWQRPEPYATVADAPQPCERRAIVRQIFGDRTSASVEIPRAGRHELWVGGSLRGRLEVRIDGRALPSTRHQLSYLGQFVPLGHAELTAGTHLVQVEVRRPRLSPGAGGEPRPMGPLALSAVGDCGGADL